MLLSRALNLIKQERPMRVKDVLINLSAQRAQKDLTRIYPLYVNV